MNSRHMFPGLLLRLGMLTMLVAACAGQAAAQPSPTPGDLSRAPASVLLRQVERGPGADTASPDPAASRRAIRDIVQNRGRFPQARIDSLLAGLERIASGRDEQARWDAVGLLADFGQSRSTYKALPGTYARLARIYGTTRDPLVRATIVGEIPALDEREQALPFLASLASAPAERQPFSGATDAAIRALARMGEPGMTILRRLYEKGELRGVRDVATNVFLNNMARSREWGPRGRSAPR